ncbi:hypothetical protein F5890DRAFT_1165738 [Lentinula detonsa]|uniref:Uncharacterized protein n=1 Tax=Lentinula detonsa TaxID=2804962 RepID=A0AA38Q121_9AGAR|nr:hypothetical protein F5890DRAFT_1165738 [Lentinula detonsa]
MNFSTLYFFFVLVTVVCAAPHAGSRHDSLQARSLNSHSNGPQARMDSTGVQASSGGSRAVQIMNVEINFNTEGERDPSLDERVGSFVKFIGKKNFGFGKNLKPRVKWVGGPHSAPDIPSITFTMKSQKSEFEVKMNKVEPNENYSIKNVRTGDMVTTAGNPDKGS